MKTLAVSLAVGVAAGLLGALCGVGGGIVMVPAFTALMGMSQKSAVATSLAVIVVTAVVATTKNSMAGGLINWKIVACVAVGAAAASWLGSGLMHKLSNQHLTKIFGVTLIVFGVQMLLKKG